MGQALIETAEIAAQDVEGVIIKNCGHWMLEECETETVNAIASFLAKS